MALLRITVFRESWAVSFCSMTWARRSCANCSGIDLKPVRAGLVEDPKDYRFEAKRETGARKMRRLPFEGMWTMRDLRVEAIVTARNLLRPRISDS